VKTKFSTLLLFYTLVIGTAVVIYPQKLDLARIYFRSYQIDMAYVELNNILSKGGDVFYAVKEYANISEEVGDLNKAIEFHQNLLKTTPDNRDVLLNLAKLFVWTEHPERATEIYEDLYRKNPNDGELLKKVVDDLIWYGQLEKAVTYLEEYVRLNPADADHHRRLAQLYSSLKRIDDMIRHYEKLERDQPAAIEWKTALAEAYFWKKDTARAIAKYEEILKSDPQRLEVYENLAKIHIWNRDLDRGYSVAARMAERFMSDTGTHRNIAELYAQTNHPVEAAAMYESLYDRTGLRGDLENAIQYRSWSGALQQALNLYARLMERHALRPDEFDDYLGMRLRAGRGVTRPQRLMNDTGLRDRMAEDIYATLIAASETAVEWKSSTREQEALRAWRSQAERQDSLIAYFLKNVEAHTAVPGLRSTLGDFYLFTHPKCAQLAQTLGSGVRMDTTPSAALADIYADMGAFSLAAMAGAGHVGRIEAERDRAIERAIQALEGKLVEAPDSQKMPWINRLLNVYRTERHARQIAAVYETKYRLQSLDPHESIRLAEWFSSQGLQKRAVEVLERHADRFMEPYPLKLLAHLYEELRESPMKILPIRERLALADPADADNQARLVIGHLETGDAVKYEKVMNRIETRFGNSDKALKALAQQFIWAEKIDLAIRLYDKILKKNPDDYDILKTKATVLYWNQRYKEADEAFRKCLALKPDDLEVLFRNAEIYTYWRKPTDARRLYDAVYRHFPRLPDEKRKSRDLRIMYASVLMRLVKLPEAVDLYRRLYRETPDNREIRLNFAEALMQTRQFSEAEIVLKTRTP